MNLTIYIDGGSRGNPGPAALGVFFAENNKKYSSFLGKATNNEAEYEALIFSLKKAKAVFGKKELNIEVKSDSELLVKQMNGEYKVKENQNLFIKAWNLKVELKNVKFTAIPREENKIADSLVNEALDAEGNKKTLF